MQEGTKNWLNYAQENLKAAKILLESNLYNSCLHNVQQSVENALKTLVLKNISSLKKLTILWSLSPF